MHLIFLIERIFFENKEEQQLMRVMFDLRFIRLFFSLFFVKKIIIIV